MSGGFDDPAAGAPAGRLALRSISSPRLRMCGVKPVLVDEFARVGVVVGAVEGDPLRLLRGRLGARDRDRVERALQQLVVVAVGALVLEPDRDSLAFAEDRPLRPFLALSVGLGPVFGPPAALWSSPRRRRARPSRSRPPGRSPGALAARTRGGRRPAPIPESAGAPPRTNTPRSHSRVPLHPCTQHQQDRVHRITVRHPRPVTTQRVRRRRRQQRLHPLPQPVRIRQPSSLTTRPIVASLVDDEEGFAVNARAPPNGIDLKCSRP